MAGASNSEGSGTSVADNLALFHKELLRDKTLQFKLDSIDPPAPPPDWLIYLARLIEMLAPVLRIIFWAGLAILAAMILWMVTRALMRRFSAPSIVPEEATTEAPQKIVFKPERARAAALLAEADQLAAEGRFSEAARVLLHRTIEDMEKALSLTIGVSLTSREIERLQPLSEQGAKAFSRIARAVETSLFGAKPLDGARFAECREAYAAFAFGRADR